MKDTKIPIGWLIPVVGVILLLGWFLGRSGWNVTEVDGGIVKLAPPTATTIIAQSTATIQENAQQPTALPVTSPPIVSESDFLPNGEPVSPESLARLIGGKPEYWTKRGPVVWGYWGGILNFV